MNDARAECTPDGWIIRFDGGTVTQLIVDYRFSFRLEGGALIVIEEPFTVDWGGILRRVPPGDVAHEVADALPLFNRTVECVSARSSGELSVEFRDGPTIGVEANSTYENWQVVMPDGEQWIGAPGGSVLHVDAD